MPDGSFPLTRPVITPSVGAQHARIVSVASFRPPRVVANDEICERIDSTDTWIRERSGIVSRRFAADGETVVDLAVPAAIDAIERAGLTPAEIDTVLVATMSYMYQAPSAAARLADRIGCARAVVMDVSAACAGFCHGVSLAADMIRAGSASNVLLVGAEKMTDIIDPTDRSTAFIFGDGAGAAVIGPSSTPAIGPTVWGSDAGGWDVIRHEHSYTEFRDGAPWPTLQMAGPRVFRWAVWEMSPVAQKAIDAAGIEPADLAAFIPHQANARIIDQMAKQLQLPPSVVIARDVVDMGNTSAASVPLAMDRMLTEGTAPHGGLALLIGFGAGLSYAAQVVELP
jgi:3-oxoacyl-[acyl-carrier-protein] synthase-3